MYYNKDEKKVNWCSEAGLDTATHHALHGAGISTWDDLYESVMNNRICRVKHVGVKRMNDILNALNNKGYEIPWWNNDIESEPPKKEEFSMSEDYYARNEKEKNLDSRIREAAKATNDPYKMAMYVFEQAQMNLLRRIEDRLNSIDAVHPKGYNVPDGYMGLIDTKHRYMLFASEADYKEYMEEQ